MKVVNHNIDASMYANNSLSKSTLRGLDSIPFLSCTPTPVWTPPQFPPILNQTLHTQMANIIDGDGA